MSYNISIDVAEDGTATINEESSYTQTAPPGRYTVTGHHVPEGEGGMETLGVSHIEGGGNYRMVANAQLGVKA